jgi:hypothetical protein
MKKLFLLCAFLSMGSGLCQVNTNVACDETKLAAIKGPSPYGPRPVIPPDHDLPADPKPQPINKGVNLQVWHNSPDRFQTGGMAMLANGNMLELDYNGTLYLVTGLDSARTVKRTALPLGGLPEPLGLLLRNNREVYINTANTVWSYDFDGTNLTQKKELLRIPTRSGWYAWNSDLDMDSTYLYAMLGSRGTMSLYNWKTQTWQMDYAMAMRNSHGMGKDDSGRIWFSDNQGNYRPATPIFLLKPGKYYGIPTSRTNGSPLPIANWTSGGADMQFSLGPVADLTPYKSDLVWIPYVGMSQSATDIHFMKSGPFKGQALIGDNRTGHINRLMVEKVDGQMQGAVIRMTGGMEGPIYRIVEDAKGNFYLGALGTSSAYWSWCTRYDGFQKMTFKPDFIGNTTFNDVQNVSLVKDGILVSFTSDISADFLAPANYRTYVFNYIKSVAGFYGGPKKDSVVVSIAGIVKRSNREILININGLLPESVLGLEFLSKLTVNNNLQSYELFYTTNHLSTVVPTTIAPVGERILKPGLKLSVRGEFLMVQKPKGRATGYAVVDMAGKNYSQLNFKEIEGLGKVDITSLKNGVYFLTMQADGQNLVQSFVVSKSRE